MVVPFRPKYPTGKKLRLAAQKCMDSLRMKLHKVPSRKYAVAYISHKTRRAARKFRYLAEDTAFELRRLSSHTESVLFSFIIILSLAVLFNAQENPIGTLTVILLLVLTVVLYAQLKIQRRMISQYVPLIDVVRIRKAQAFSRRIRLVNLYEAKQKLFEIGQVSNFRIAYDVINESFSPVSVQAASLGIKLADGRRIELPEEMSVLDVGPKNVSGTELLFTAKKPVKFTDIEWLELRLKGNAKKSVRIKPDLYVNIITRSKVPKTVFEPFSKFKKRPEMSD